MRVVVLPADETGCGMYRLVWPAHLLKQARPDWQVEVYRPGDLMVGKHPDGSLAAVQGIDLDGIDLMVMQRVGSRTYLELLRAVQKRGTAVVLDADDALWAIHRDNTAHKVWNHPRSGVSWRTMDQAAKEADLVTVTTDALARRYGAHGRVEVIPNRVPASVVGAPSIKVEDAPVTFGWSGFVGTHPADLHVMGDAPQRLLLEHPEVHARIIGDARGIQEAWDLDLDAVGDRVSATGAVKFENYPVALTLLDVGVVPLEDSVFNRAKSALKAAEYAAQGVPAVVTPTPANRQLAEEGYPLAFASTPVQWVEQIRCLLRVPEYREQVSSESLAAAQAHTMENHLGEWEQAWLRAANRRARLAV